MAYEIELINGVTKRENLGVYFYYFPKATIKVNVTNPVIDNQVIEIRQIDNFPNFISTTYGDITDKLGSSNAVEYVDELAVREFFFEISGLNEIDLFGKIDKINVTNNSINNMLNNIIKLLVEQNFLLKSINQN